MAGSYSPDFTVLRSGEPEYDRARSVFNLAGVPAPAEAVIARTVNEVRSCGALRRLGVLPLWGAQHRAWVVAAGARPRRPAIRVEHPLIGLRIDPISRTAWVPAGTPAGTDA